MVIGGLPRTDFSVAAREQGRKELAATLMKPTTGWRAAKCRIAYEMVWWQVYDQMSPSAAPGVHRSDKGA